jgi:RNA polymerase sigma factor (sigma-70 family)
MHSLEASPSNEQLAEVYRCCVAMVRRRARQILGSDAGAKDAAQEVFITFMRYCQRRRVDHVEGLLYQMATGVSLRRLMKQRRSGEQAMDETTESRAFDRNATAPDSRVLLKCILELVDEEQAVFAIYYHVDGISQAEIAALMTVPQRTVSRHLEAFAERARRFANALPLHVAQRFVVEGPVKNKKG